MVTTQERDMNSRQPSRKSSRIPGLSMRLFAFNLRFHTITPAIKKENPSIKSAHPGLVRVTITPPSKVPKTTPILLINPIIAFPSCNFSFGNISGSTPDMAGHQRAFNTPKSAPITASNKMEEKPAIKEIALTATRKLPIMSLPPTMRLR